MSQQLLNRSNVRTAFEQVCGKGMAERMTRSPLGEPGFCHSLPDGFLHQRFVNVMVPLFLGLAIDPVRVSWGSSLVITYTQ